MDEMRRLFFMTPSPCPRPPERRPSRHDRERGRTRLARGCAGGRLAGPAKRNADEIRGVRPHCGPLRDATTAATEPTLRTLDIRRTLDTATGGTPVSRRAIMRIGTTNGADATTDFANMPRGTIILAPALRAPPADAERTRPAVRIRSARPNRNTGAARASFVGGTVRIAPAQVARFPRADAAFALEARRTESTQTEHATIRATVGTDAIRVIAGFGRTHDAVSAGTANARKTDATGGTLSVACTGCADIVEAETVRAGIGYLAWKTFLQETQIRTTVGIIAIFVVAGFGRGDNTIATGFSESIGKNDGGRRPGARGTTCRHVRPPAVAVHAAFVCPRPRHLRTARVRADGVDGGTLAGRPTFGRSRSGNLNTLVTAACGTSLDALVIGTTSIETGTRYSDALEIGAHGMDVRALSGTGAFIRSGTRHLHAPAAATGGVGLGALTVRGTDVGAAAKDRGAPLIAARGVDIVALAVLRAVVRANTRNLHALARAASGMRRHALTVQRTNVGAGSGLQRAALTETLKVHGVLRAGRTAAGAAPRSRCVGSAGCP